MAKKIKILSIDGGGIRGVIPAMLMAEIEKRTGQAIAELFDLIAGTSTGGILALGAAKPAGRAKGKKDVPQYTAEDMVQLYETEGPRIFSRSPWRTVRSLGGVIDEIYPSEGIETVLEEYFGDARLSEAVTDVLVPSYEIEGRTPLFFKSRKARENPADDYLMRHAARATSAAPTFFEPVHIKTKSRAHSLVDGGVVANNPAMCAYAEVRRHQPELDDVLIVSLGTGDPTRPLPFDQAKDWGMAEWVVPLFSVFLDGMDDSVDYQLQHILATPPRSPRRYYRYQVKLNEGNDNIDDASRTNVRVLKMIADELIKANNAVFDEMCKQLVG